MLGKRIKEIRKALPGKLSQEDFGKTLGLSRDAISSYEQGRVLPSEAIIKLICQTYGVSYAWLKHGADVEMFNRPETRREKLNALLDGENEFAKEVMDLFLDLGDDEWNLLKKMVDRLVDKQKKADR